MNTCATCTHWRHAEGDNYWPTQTGDHQPCAEITSSYRPDNWNEHPVVLDGWADEGRRIHPPRPHLRPLGTDDHLRHMRTRHPTTPPAVHRVPLPCTQVRPALHRAGLRLRLPDTDPRRVATAPKGGHQEVREQHRR